MKVIEVTEKEVKAAFDAAKSDEVKNVLAALFCKPEDRVKPSLDDYKSIKTYEDACEALGEEPIEGSLGDHVDKHIIALIKLETISRALWGKDWQPKPDPDGSKYFYYPWFALYTQSEMDSMSEEDRGALLGAPAHLVRMLGSALCMRIIAPRVRLRLLGSACARKQRKRLSISVFSSRKSGLIIWHSISL